MAAVLSVGNLFKSLIPSLLGNHTDRNFCLWTQRNVFPPSRIFLSPCTEQTLNLFSERWRLPASLLTVPIKKNSQNFKFQMSLNSTVQSNMLNHQSVIDINIVFLSESRGTRIVYQTYQGLFLRGGLRAIISISCPSVVFIVHTWSNLYFVNSYKFSYFTYFIFYISYICFIFLFRETS